MGIVLARIDNRFVHGQILEGWVPHMKATCIIVANDGAAGNAIQKAAMEASVPDDILLEVLKVEDAVNRLLKGEFEAGRSLLLFGTSEDAIRAVELGLKIDEVNVGNIHFCPGKLQISPSVSVDSVDMDSFRRLNDRGVRVTIRCVPTDKSRDIWEVVKK